MRPQVMRSAAAVLMIAVAAALVAQSNAQARIERELAAQQATIRSIEKQGAQRTAVDWAAVAGAAERSVMTIEAGEDLGTAWFVRSDARGSDLVTNFHLVANAWNGGSAAVVVRQGDVRMTGMVVRVDTPDDLAIVRIEQRIAPMSVKARPRVASYVIAVGAPLGLDGTVTLGVVSGYRSIAGSDYVQFSAPISPGNSGGPVLDQAGHVVAIASANLVGDGVEGLSLGIPVQVASAALATCTAAGG